MGDGEELASRVAGIEGGVQGRLAEERRGFVEEGSGMAAETGQ